MRSTTPILTAALAVMLGACASTAVNSRDSVARLERDLRTAPSSASINRSLGIAYYKAERYAEARSALETAARLDPRDGTTALYLGLSAEAQGDFATAKRAYGSYITYGRTNRVRSQLQSHLTSLTRKELQQDAKVAVQQESRLATEPGPPRTIAVLPLRFSGADSSLRVLERGFADLLTTDLAHSAQLTLVERSRVQALLDEMTLQQSGATDSRSNVRAGRLVRAGRVVQGSILQIGGTQLRVDAAVVDVPSTQIRGTAQQADQLEQIFALEKKLALDLFRELGVTLTVAERNAVEQRATRSLAAFLAYSRGLTAEDQGRFDDARRYFDEAARLDPGFSAAQTKGAEARALTLGSSVNAGSLELGLRGTPEGAVVTAAARGFSQPAASGPTGSTLGGTALATAGDVNPSPSGAATGAGLDAPGATVPGQKDPVSSGTGSDNPTGTGRVTIIVTRPRTP